MNSIRWMPMIRWLKFPFRVHILHKTVQLSVHELWGGCVREWLKACPTVPPSNSEKRAGWHFSISSLSAFHLHNPLAFFFFSGMKGFVQFGCFAFCCRVEKCVVCNSRSFSFLMMRMIEIIYFLHKTGKQNTPLRNFSQIPTWHIICVPCQWCNIIPHCEQVSNFSLCESESEQGSYSLPDNCQNNSR